MIEKRVPAKFYRSKTGNEPVRDWLKGLDQNDRKLIGDNIKTVEYGYPLGMPICRPLGGGLLEVRIKLHKRIARVIFCIYREEMILLHGFIKKTQKTPKNDLDLAANRKAILEGEKI